MITIKDFNPKPYEELARQYGEMLTETYTLYPTILMEELRFCGKAAKYEHFITECIYCDKPQYCVMVGAIEVCRVCANLTFWYTPGCVREHFI